MSNLTFKQEGTDIMSELGSIKFTDTQEIKILEIEKEGQTLYSVQKWWRKSNEEEWKPGKGFHMTPEQFQTFKNVICS